MLSSKLPPHFFFQWVNWSMKKCNDLSEVTGCPSWSSLGILPSTHSLSITAVSRAQPLRWILFWPASALFPGFQCNLIAGCSQYLYLWLLLSSCVLKSLITHSTAGRAPPALVFSCSLSNFNKWLHSPPTSYIQKSVVPCNPFIKKWKILKKI